MRIEAASTILLTYSIFIIDLQEDIGVKKKDAMTSSYLFILNYLLYY